MIMSKAVYFTYSALNNNRTHTQTGTHTHTFTNLAIRYISGFFSYKMNQKLGIYLMALFIVLRFVM